MKKITTLILAATFSLAAACGSGDEVKQMDKLAEAACACKDMDCYKKADEAWDKYGETMRDKYPKKKDAPKSLRDAYKKNRKAMRECRNKLREAKTAAPAAGAK